MFKPEPRANIQLSPLGNISFEGSKHDMSRRVVFIIESPLSPRDTKRFGFARLEARGFSVEVWDLSPLWFPTAFDYSDKSSSTVSIHLVNSRDRLINLCEGLHEDDTIVQVGGTSPATLRRRRKELLLIAHSRARWTLLHVGPLPAFDPDLERCIQSKLAGRERVINRWHQNVRKTLENLRVFGLIGPLAPRNRRLPVFTDIWSATGTRGVAPTVMSRSTRVHLIHSLDYDQLLDRQDSIERPVDRIVFIDSMGPIHSDYTLHGLNSRQSLSEYAALVGRGLDLLERELGLRTVIAAHPRAAVGQLDHVYFEREVVHGRTVDLVATSTVVACAEASTAVGFAVALNRPIALFLSSTSPSLVQRLNVGLLCALDPLTINLDTGRIENDLLEPDLVLYERYMERYVKVPHSPQRLFWDVVADSLEQHP